MGLLKGESLEDFKERLREWIRENDPKFETYPKWLWRDFIEYWSQKNDRGKLHYYEMEKKWSTGLRIATFRKRSLKDPRWNESKQKPSNVYPGIYHFNR